MKNSVVQRVAYGINWVKLFIKDVWEEAKPKGGRVAWPTRRMVLGATGVVLLTVAFATLVIWLFDMIFSWIIRLIKAITD